MLCLLGPWEKLLNILSNCTRSHESCNNKMNCSSWILKHRFFICIRDHMQMLFSSEMVLMMGTLYIRSLQRISLQDDVGTWDGQKPIFFFFPVLFLHFNQRKQGLNQLQWLLSVPFHRSFKRQWCSSKSIRTTRWRVVVWRWQKHCMTTTV